MSDFSLDEEMRYFFLVYLDLAFSLLHFVFISVLLSSVCAVLSSVCVDLLQVLGFTALV